MQNISNNSDIKNLLSSFLWRRLRSWTTETCDNFLFTSKTFDYIIKIIIGCKSTSRKWSLKDPSYTYAKYFIQRLFYKHYVAEVSHTNGNSLSAQPPIHFKSSVPNVTVLLSYRCPKPTNFYQALNSKRPTNKPIMIVELGAVRP